MKLRVTILQCAGIALIAALSLTACTKSSDSASAGGATVTLALTYSPSTVLLFQSNPANIAPTISGGSATGCTASPSLPAGLTLNATTCAISGTPTAAAAMATYTISATGTNAAGTGTIAFAVKATTATTVYGQGGNFTTTTTNNGGISANSLAAPRDVSLGASGVYVADVDNTRVLYYATGSTTATRVYGQLGSFTTATANNGGITANSLNYAEGVGADSTGVYIADSANNRVLYYAGTSTTATRVYGQPGYTTGTNNNGGLSATSLSNPSDVFPDGTGIYIVDTGNHRVLHYTGVSVTADRVYGQTLFTTGGSGVSANSFSNPAAVIADSSGVYIADGSNNRVLFFPGTATTATRVYGQPDFTSNTANNGGRSASSLDSPRGVALSTYGVYIADWSNRRVLYFAGTSTVATGIFGQAGSFTAFTFPATAADNFSQPFRIAVSADALYLPDWSGARVIYFP